LKESKTRLDLTLIIQTSLQLRKLRTQQTLACQSLRGVQHTLRMQLKCLDQVNTLLTQRLWNIKQHRQLTKD